MTVTTYTGLPQEAMAIRQTVFVREQGFHDEPDEFDPVALHFVLFDGGSPIGTCRAYPEGQEGFWMMGRFAILPEYRGKGLGALLMARAEEALRAAGGSCLRLHAQLHAAGFYQRMGFLPAAEPDIVQGSPHLWMEKPL